MSTLSDAVSDYCASEHFFFLDTALKEHAGALLDHWCQTVGSEVSAASVERGLQEISRLDLPMEIRQAVPHLLKEFCDYLAGRAGFPEAEQWGDYVTQAEAEYRASFRQDGTIKGQTVRKKFADVGRNDPCPCGSGVKFKKCCIQLLS